MDGRKRTVQIKFRVTEAERDLILEKMKLVPTRNMAAYLRKIAIDGYIIQIDHADIKAMTAEIQKIGVNVNQIHHPPLDSFRQLLLLRYLSADFTGLLTFQCLLISMPAGVLE